MCFGFGSLASLLPHLALLLVAAVENATLAADRWHDDMLLIMVELTCEREEVAERELEREREILSS